MEVLKYDLDLPSILPIEFHQFDPEEPMLWVLHADKIPPHLGVSSKNSYFSLKYNGKDEFLPVDSVIKLLKQKKIKTLLFVLRDAISAQEIELNFSTFTRTETGRTTCLNPIKTLLNCPNVQTLKELLAELDDNEQIESVRGLNIDQTFQGIIDYSIQDIHNRLKVLEDA
ncbi:hypothetical protein OAU25_02270 [Crocinitomicaceae bacterium]|nr:hypothetical protein [Crocinitomicaceae bacterium]